MNTIILAFSVGWTPVLYPFPKKGYSVITVTVNTGGFSSATQAIATKAKQLGAVNTSKMLKMRFMKISQVISLRQIAKGGVYPV